MTIEPDTRLKHYPKKDYIDVKLTCINGAVISINHNDPSDSMNDEVEQLVRVNTEEADLLYFSEVFQRISCSSFELVDSLFDVALMVGWAVVENQCALHFGEGNKWYVSAYCSPIRDTSGGIIGVVVVFQDITHVKTMREEFVSDDIE